MKDAFLEMVREQPLYVGVIIGMLLAASIFTLAVTLTNLFDKIWHK